MTQYYLGEGEMKDQTTYEFHIDGDGLFAIPIVNGEAQNGMLLEGITEKDIQDWVYDEWQPTMEVYHDDTIYDDVRILPEDIEIGYTEMKGYFMGHIGQAKLCNDLGEPM